MTVRCTRCKKTFASDSTDPGESVAFDNHTCSNPVLEPRPGEPWKDYVERQRKHDDARHARRAGHDDLTR